MSKDESEEKTLPASEKKLRDGRKKGQTSKSKDLTSGFVLLAVVIYLIIVWPTVVDRSKVLIDMVSLSIVPDGQPYMTKAMNAMTLAVTILLQTIAPLVVVIVFMTVVTGMIGTLGPVFSFELIKPNFDHINPAKGLERIFCLRNVVEFGKSLLKVFILVGIFAALLAGWMQSLFEAPACGMACVGPFLVTVLKVLAGVAAAAFVVIGVVDVGLQFQLFLRDMKMTRTEYKREQKDIEGDPLIRSHRRSIRRQSARESAIGVERAVFAVAAGDTIVALRYGRGAPVPTVVAKGTGPEGNLLREKAYELGIPVIEDEKFANNLYGKAKLREYIDSEFYEPAIRILIDYKLM
jgi:type III secretion protein U